MNNEIRNAKDIPLHKPMLAFISYPGAMAQKFCCWVYPQWLQDGSEYSPVSSEAFPDRGAIYVTIQGGKTSQDICDKYGTVAVVSFNKPLDENMNYDGTEGRNDNLFAFINEERPDNSHLELRQLESHPIGRKNLFQIVEAESNVSFDKPINRPIELYMNTDAPLTPLIMIEKVEGSSLVYYGPFSAQVTSSGEYEVNAVQSYKNLIYKIDSSDIEDIMTVKDDFRGQIVAKFMDTAPITQLHKRPNTPNSIDWVTDEELLEVLTSLLRNEKSLGFKTEEIDKIKKAFEKNPSWSGLRLTDSRKARMLKFLETPSIWENEIDILAKAFTRPEVSEKLVDLALSDQYFEKFSSTLAENDAIAEKLEQRRSILLDEIEKLEARAKTAQELLDETNRKNEQAKSEGEKTRDEALAGAREELDSFEAKINAANAELKAIQDEIGKLERRSADIINNIDGKTESLTSDILKSRVLGNIIGGTLPKHDASSSPELPRRIAPEISADDARLTDAEVLEKIHQRLNDAGRNLSATEAINLLTCIMGSNMTVLSGLPGTGKTSMVELLAGALGLTRPRESRFTKIAVERGWTSHRDYIGYYNPLSGKLEASNTSIFEDFMAFNEEYTAAGTCNGITDSSILGLVLLDEANLSVIENYWSPFLSNCDNFLTRPTELNMQGHSPLILPSNARWLATVNYDHTTEALSDRFLDRSWVINVEAPEFKFDQFLLSTNEPDFSAVQPFSYATLMRVFGPKDPKAKSESRGMDINSKKILSKLVDTCRSYGRPVSFRSQRAIMQYILTAAVLMEEFEAAAEITAIDYAISQRVLPSVSGTGIETRKFLEELANSFPLLKKTKERIERMIQIGDSDGYYQFFA